ncbi:MAG TPA: sigma-70 family RNA polymerase sigma factor [Patescibacteria group bacterium]|nr:sigma-70 family RNA polymerase sigma factor [Patescibacteria group bacterium]
MPVKAAADRALVRDVLDAKPQAWDRLVQRSADSIWTACRLLTGDDAEARTAFAEVIAGLRADGFRRLRPYDGSSRIETFVALVTRELLAERLMRLFQPGCGDAGWTAFERVFGPDITRIIARRLPGAEREDLRRDAYQEICLAVIADDYRRLKAYRGTGSFTGFVLQMVDRLLIDFIRRALPRRPAADPTPLPEWDDIRSPEPSAEAALVEREDERLLALAVDVLRHAAEALSETERLYLHIALGSGEAIPAREVARLMRRPVEEVYKLKQRVMTRLRDSLEKNPTVKLWRASV